MLKALCRLYQQPAIIFQERGIRMKLTPYSRFLFRRTPPRAEYLEKLFNKISRQDQEYKRKLQNYNHDVLFTSKDLSTLKLPEKPDPGLIIKFSKLCLKHYQYYSNEDKESIVGKENVLAARERVKELEAFLKSIGKEALNIKKK